MSVQNIEIEIVSDVVCPWCYLGQRRLKLALGQVSDVIAAQIAWKPYQFEPNAPPEGFDTMDYLARKIGGVDAVRRSHDMLSVLAREIDLPIALDKAKIFPNTFDAHRLVHWAGVVGSDVQDTVSLALFDANFVDGRNVGDHAVLTEIAVSAGMDETIIREKLSSDVDRDHVKAEIEKARRMGVSGVPCFIIDRQYAVTGAQSVEIFANALRQIAGMKQQVSA